MVCPVCGVECRDVKVCPECGWDFSLSEGDPIPDPPVGRCEGIDGFLDVGHFSLTIHKKIHERTVEREISYRDIRDVVFREASKTESGFLGVRGRGDPLPVVTTELDAVCDESALIFNADMGSEFHDAYTYIERLVQILGTDRSSQQDRDRVCCPKCKASRYTVENKTHRRLYGRSSSLLLALIYLVFWICVIRSGIMTEYICLECGNRWHMRAKEQKDKERV